MKCDRCKIDNSYWDMTPVKWTPDIMHYWVSEGGRIRPMKALFCGDCLKEVGK